MYLFLLFFISFFFLPPLCGRITVILARNKVLLVFRKSSIEKSLPKMVNQVTEDSKLFSNVFRLRILWTWRIKRRARKSEERREPKKKRSRYNFKIQLLFADYTIWGYSRTCCYVWYLDNYWMPANIYPFHWILHFN